MRENKLKIRIVVCYHKDSAIITNNVYLPLQVGRALSNKKLPIQGDNTGDNKSSLNGLYCELTGLYWAWKNLDSDYIGLCHYRRIYSFITFKDSVKYLINRTRYYFKKIAAYFRGPCYNVMGFIYYKQSNNQDAFLQISSDFSSDLENYLENNRETLALTLKRVKIGNLTCHYFFGVVSGIVHLDIVKSLVMKKYSYLYKYLDDTLNSNSLHCANMVIMRKDVLNDYCTFLFDILDSHIDYCVENSIIISKDEKIISRLSGYLGEILTSTYISYLKATKGNKSVKELALVKYE